MKAEELRIGNLVYNHHNEITSVDINTFNKFKYPTMGGNPANISPIPLTEEILFKCGFEKLTTKSETGYKASSYSYRNGYSFIVCFDDGVLSVDFWQGNEKRYLHQLQNLFHALTNEELQIEL